MVTAPIEVVARARAVAAKAPPIGAETANRLRILLAPIRQHTAEAQQGNAA